MPLAKLANAKLKPDSVPNSEEGENKHPSNGVATVVDWHCFEEKKRIAQIGTNKVRSHSSLKFSPRDEERSLRAAYYKRSVALAQVAKPFHADRVRTCLSRD